MRPELELGDDAEVAATAVQRPGRGGRWRWRVPAQIRRAHDALKPWLSSGIYANMLNFDEADRLLDACGGPERYARLGRVKAAYDPDNFFSLNANIQPRP